MKTTVKNILLLWTFSFLLFFGSCQKESIEIIQEAPEEVLTVDSKVATLMKQTSANDGSKDNIIDNSNCFNVVLPVTINVNGLEIIVDSEEDFAVIEAILDQFEDDDDLVEMVFPITIILANFDEVLISNQEELEEYMDLCTEDDDDIECIDFVYPITFSLYNSKYNVIKTTDIHNDREMHRFIKNISSSDIISINFPIQVTLSDESVLDIHNMMELQHALENAVNSCDEDDDNDFGDDDFTKERLDALLIKCPWVIHEMLRANVSLNDHFREGIMKFYENGVVKLRKRNGDQLTGEWVTRITDRGALLKMTFDNLTEFTLEWIVHDIEGGRIKLFTEGGNRIILKKNCDIDFEFTIERVENYLKKCQWRITQLSVDNTNIEDAYIGTPFKFYDDQLVKIRVQGELVQGTYEVFKINGDVYLKITLEGRPELKLLWIINILEEHQIKLYNENNKMILKRFCENDLDDDLKFINNVLLGGEWMVALYNDEGENKTEAFNELTFDFKSSKAIIVEGLDTLKKGSWLTLRDDGKLKLALNFGDHELLSKLNHKWKIAEITEGRIELHNYANNGELEEKLVFEKT